MTSLSLDLREVQPDMGPLVGGKALSLGTLAHLGFPVPPGLVLTTEAYRQILAEAALADEVRRAWEQAQGGRTPDTSALQERLVKSGLPSSLLAALEGPLQDLGLDDGPLAVRSSGVFEDLEGASFAGQYLTLLNVRGRDELQAAVLRCFASVLEGRVLTYAARHVGSADVLGMAVVVQRLVTPEVSGVLFTVNPLTGREGEAVIEAVFGLGEALVSGRVNADHWVVSPLTGEVIEASIATQGFALRPTDEPSSPVREEDLSEEVGSRPTLTVNQLAGLAEVGAQIQEEYGRPMDVEWVFSSRGLHVVQARPITALSFADDIGEWTTADFKDGGVSSDVCSPFMWSLYEHAFNQSMQRYAEDMRLRAPGDEPVWASMFFARPYWNLGATKEMLAPLPGYNERSFDLDLGIEITYDGDGQTTGFTLGGILRALPTLLALKRGYREKLDKNRAFVAGFDAAKARFDLSPEEIRLLEDEPFAARFRALVYEFHLHTEGSYFSTIYASSNAKMEFKVHFERARGHAGGDLSYVDLVSGLRNLSHLRPMQDLHDTIERLRKEVRDVSDDDVVGFANRWAHHSRRELDIRVPRWCDDLPFVRSMMEQAYQSHRSDHSPQAQAERGERQYQRERQKALQALGWRFWARRSFDRDLARVRQFAWWREEMRDYSMIAYHLVRRWTIEAARRLTVGGILEDAEDVWGLRFQEVVEALEGGSPETARKRAAAGRRMMRSFRHFDIPDEIRGRAQSASTAPARDSDGVLSGIGCSSGRATGTARILQSLDEIDRLQPGEILVTRFTDPGWTPLFGVAAAVVTETGGLLSHAALVSREYGLPAVLAVSRATQRIPDGSRITVDGSAGTVSIDGGD